MAASDAGIRVALDTLNTNIERFNDYTSDIEDVSRVRTLHFVGSIEPEDATLAVIEHWDTFLEQSRNALNADDLTREETLGYVDGINLDYKRLLEIVQSRY